MNVALLRRMATEHCDRIEALQRVVEAGRAVRACFEIGEDYPHQMPPGEEVNQRLREYDVAVAILEELA